MRSKSLQLSSLSIARYGSSFVLGLMLCMASAPVLAHVGHNSEFAGGDAAKIMQPIEVDANKAAALGIKTEAIAPTPDGGILKVPSTSLVDANGQKLVYIQEGTTYKPISVQIGSDSGDVVEIKEGNLVSGNQIVTQGATLLYSEALRGKPQAAAPASPATSPATSQAETQPAQGSSPLMWVAGAGVLLVGGFAVFGLKGKDQ
ncbi:cobalt transporter [Tychonema sp. LEGE 07203]|uniref:cobalt transporter n=1 Tax=Tychonema sp. LEGE 07203 TaxID=1828671 RepID=UPI001881E74C|nr:cobalt transporter [Tychonema sp. LEGE 07203]MBE9096569.1 cobalt transporter [Tychonema sp. LEGE 07203]